MWGSGPSHPYYVCAVTHQRAANIPPGHPPSVNLSEHLLLEATTTFLAHAVYGPDRLAYWDGLLRSADQPDEAAPADRRSSEVNQTIADLERRLRSQVLALEDTEVAPAARRQIGARIVELEQMIADHQASLAKLTAPATHHTTRRPRGRCVARPAAGVRPRAPALFARRAAAAVRQPGPDDRL